jgi:hypothetical protein
MTQSLKLGLRQPNVNVTPEYRRRYNPFPFGGIRVGVDVEDYPRASFHLFVEQTNWIKFSVESCAKCPRWVRRISSRTCSPTAAGSDIAVRSKTDSYQFRLRIPIPRPPVGRTRLLVVQMIRTVDAGVVRDLWPHD